GRMEQDATSAAERGAPSGGRHGWSRPRLGGSASGHVTTVMPPRKKAQAPSPMPSSIRVEDVQPRVDCGDESVKRCVGDSVRVTATVIAHGTKVVRAAVCFKSADAKDWDRAPMHA